MTPVFAPYKVQKCSGLVLYSQMELDEVLYLHITQFRMNFLNFLILLKNIKKQQRYNGLSGLYRALFSQVDQKLKT